MTSHDPSPHNARKRHRYRDWLLVGMFLLGINIPLLAFIFKIDPVPNFDRLAPAPTMPRKPQEIAKLPGLFSAYYNDHFGFRRSLTQLHHRLMFDVFHLPSSNRVQFGNNGWLFLKSEQTLDDWRSLYPFKDQELIAWQTMLERRHQFLAELGIPYIFVITPNKHTIYGKELPSHLQPSNNPSRLDQLIAHLEATDSPVEILDLRPSLERVSRTQRTYHRTDTHWNLLGAYVGYSALADRLNQLQLPVDIPNLEQLTFKQETALGGDLSRMIGQKRSLTEERIIVDSFPTCEVTQPDGSSLIVEDLDIPGDEGTITLCPTAKIKRAVVFHDSFGKLLYPYLASQFQRSVFIWSDDFKPQVIQQEQPNIVIQQLVERRLFNREPNLTEFEN